MVHQNQKPQIKDILEAYFFLRSMGKNTFLFVASSKDLLRNSMYIDFYWAPQSVYNLRFKLSLFFYVKKLRTTNFLNVVNHGRLH